MYRIVALILLFCTTPLLASAQSVKLDSLRTYIDLTVDDTETFNSLSELVQGLIRSGQTEEAKEWLLSGFSLAERAESREGRFMVLVEFGNLYVSRQMPDSAMIMLDQAEFYLETPDDQSKYQKLSGNIQALLGNQILAIERYERSRFLADSLGNARRVADVNMDIGNIQAGLGENIEALRSFYNTLEYAELNRDSLLTAIASNNVGWQFQLLDNQEQAEYFLLRSEAISESIGFKENLRRTLLNLANLYSHIGEYSRSEDYFNRSLELANQMDDALGKVRVYFNLGVMESRRGNLNEAERLLRFALDDSTYINHKEGEYRSASGLGDLEVQRNNYAQAIRWYVRANQIAEDQANPNLRVESYEKLYRAYREMGNLSESLRWLEERNQLNDSLQNTEQSRLLAEYETLFNIKRTEQESEILRAREQQAQSQLALQSWLIIFSIGGVLFLLITSVILVKSNHERQEINQELKSTNDELNGLNKKVQDQNSELEKINDIKNKLFAIIAHDLRGPLGSLQSLLYLIRDHELSESEMNEITTTLEKNLQENASMMDNLLAWASAQMNGIKLKVRNFMLIQAIKSVTDQIVFQAQKKNIDLKVDVPETIEVQADYDMIKLVVRNLIANAIKFSPGGSVITVKAVKKKEMAEIQIIDQGMGMTKEEQNKLFSNEHFTKRGTENEKGSGLGLMLCKEFVENHQGKFWLTSIKDKGTTFYFSIPLASSKKIDLAEADTNKKAKVAEEENA